MKRKQLTFLSSVFACAAVGVLAVAGVKASETKATKSVAEEVVEPQDPIPVDADLSRFRIRSGNVGTIAIQDSVLTYTGGWDSNFLVTDQFDTLDTKYSISTHVSHDTYEGTSEGYFGLALYLDATTYITFQLKWDASVPNSIAEGVWLNHVGAQWDNVYQSAILPNGDYETRGTFTDVWSDSMWTDLNGQTVNLRTNSHIEMKSGFDVTYTVERTMYKNRMADIIQCRIDATTEDGVTPASFLSPAYAVDAFTNPLGLNNTRAAFKPQIGFHESSIGSVKLSGIKFTSLSGDTTYMANVRKMGVPAAVKLDVDYENDKVTVDSYHTCGGGAVLENLNIPSHNYHISADISGVGDNTANNAAGFTIYYNDLNFFNIFYEWNGAYTSIPGITMHWTVNGQNTNCTTALRNPWADTVINGEWGSNFSDFGGWCTDAYIAEGADGNFNNFRNECTDITIESGFNMTLYVTRVTRGGLQYDEVCLCVSALDNSGVRRNWYTCAVYFDAYTNPLGGQASPLIDEIPTIALYGGHRQEVESSVTFSNIKLNGKKVAIADPVAIDIDGEKDVFKVGEAFTLGDDAIVYSEYENEGIRILEADEYTVTQASTEAIGTYQVTITSKENTKLTVSYDVDVVELSAIAIDSEAKDIFYVGETFEEPAVIAGYTNGDAIVHYEEVEATFTGFDSTSAGSKTVTASYTEDGITKTDEFTVYVVGNLTSITVANPKVSYMVGETFVVPTTTAHYDGGQADDDVTDNVTCTGYNLATGGSQQVTVSYTEHEVTKTVTYDIVVVPNLTSITLAEEKVTTYTVGQEFVKPTVTAHYDGDGEDVDVTDEATFTGYDMSKAGTYEVEVSYTENGVTKTATYEITVVTPAPAKKGCGGNIATTSIIVSGIALLAVAAIIISKKRKTAE